MRRTYQVSALVIIALAAVRIGLLASGSAAPARSDVLFWPVIAAMGQVACLFWIATYRNALKAAAAREGR